MADDVNDYGKFEAFYKPAPESKEEWWQREEPRVPEDRPNPFERADFRGSQSRSGY